MGMESNIYLNVGGMTCGGCTGIVENVVKSVDGVYSASAPFLSNKRSIVAVTLDPATDVNKIFEALAEMDFTAEVVKKEEEKSAKKQYNQVIKKLKEEEKREKEEELRKLNENTLEIVQMEPIEPSKVVLSVRGMTCAGCQMTIEKNLASKPGVLRSSVGLLSEKAEVYYDKSIIHDIEIRDIINSIGSYEAKILVEAEVNVLNLLLNSVVTVESASRIESTVKSLRGVKEVSVDIDHCSARIKYDNDLTGPRSIIEQIQNVGYNATISEEKANLDYLTKKQEMQRLVNELRVALAFTIPVFLIGMVLHKIPGFEKLFMIIVFPGVTLSQFLLFILTTPVQFGIGKRFYVNAYKAIKSGGANMDVLIALGTSAAYFYSCFMMILNMLSSKEAHMISQSELFFDTSAMLISFILLGKYFEAMAKGKTSEAIQKLMEMQPHNATLVVLDEHGDLITEKTIEIDLVQRGDVLKVVPGARIPTDGVLIQGQSTVDESMISGESLPVSKKVGDQLIAGTINQSGLMRMKATKVGTETGLAQIIRLVQDAQTGKAPIQSFADFVASWFVPVVVMVGIITFIIWLTIMYVSGIPGILTHGVVKSPFLIALLFAISVVVIACPCALGLATPTAIMVGTGIGAMNGVLIKGGPVLEMAHKITAVIFDKTGTLTYGKPKVTDTKMLTDKISKTEFFKLVGSAEKGSEHPLALAITNYAETELKLFLNSPDVFESKSGEGIICTVSGRRVIIGNRLFMDKNQISIPETVDDMMQCFEKEGKTVIIAGIDNFLAGIVAVADQVKPEAKVTVATLKKMGIQSWMVTGDNKRTADAIARQVGLHNVFAEVLPSMKAKKVKELKTMGHVVAMVGDGINDSPALAESDVGIAIGAGTDIAIEAAGMVLVKSDLRDVVTAIDLSKKTFNRIRMNYVWAMFYNLSGIPLAAGILVPANIVVPPMLAGLAMAFSSVSVVGSSLMLKLYKKPNMAMVDPFDSPLEPRKSRSMFSSIKKKNTDEIELSLVEQDFLREPVV